LTALLRFSADLRLAAFRARGFYFFEQSLPGQLAVLGLRPGILNRHADAARPMAQRYCSRHLIHVLTARTAGAGERLLQVSFRNAGGLHPLFDTVSHTSEKFSKTRATSRVIHGKEIC